jgi:C-terminal processing protease CtpA/Prc
MTAPVSAQTNKNSIQGIWSISFDSPEIHLKSLLEFVEEKSKIKVYIISHTGFEINFSDVHFEKNTLKLKALANFNNMKLPITITAEVNNNILKGQWNIPFAVNGTLTGEKKNTEFNKSSRGRIFYKVWKTVNNNYYSPTFDGVDWNKQKRLFEKKVLLSKSTGEMVFLIREMLGKLKSSHIAFFSKIDFEKIEEEQNVTWKTVNENIGYIKIKEFYDDSKQSEDLLNKAFTEFNNKQTLIIDLRDNSGGGLEVAFALGNHLFQGQQCIGYFYTNKRANIINSDDFIKIKTQNFQIYSENKTDDFLKKLKEQEAFNLVFNNFNNNNNSIYKGNVVVLANERVYSTAEAFVSSFNESKRGIIIGKKTGGKMLASEIVEIDKNWNLQIPIANFITCKGERIEGNGVKPNIEFNFTEDENKDITEILEILRNKTL